MQIRLSRLISVVRRRLPLRRLLLAAIGLWRGVFSRRAAFALIAAGLALVVVVVAAEVLVRAYDLDWRIIRKLLYYQAADLPAYEAVLDPVLFFRLKPNAEANHGWVRIDRFGYRGRDHSAVKPPGVYRILCVGGSNVYGLGLSNDDTWPAQLERELNEHYTGRYEVWNGGACAYVGTQMARIADEMLAKYDPDLIFIGLSNAGAPAFLAKTPVEPYFEKFPSLWLKLFRADFAFPLRRRSPAETRSLIERVRLYRFFYAAWMGVKKTGWSDDYDFEIDNEIAIRKLTQSCAARGVRTCFYVYPGADRDWIKTYTLLLKTPICALGASGLPEEYGNVHPTAYAATWCAQEIARRLADAGLLGAVSPKTPPPEPPASRVASPADYAGFSPAGAVRIEKDTTYLPGGSFMMGCSPGDPYCYDDETPRHQITLSPFRIDRTEATNAQYAACVRAGACNQPVAPDRFHREPGDYPVVGVRFEQAAAFCRWRRMRLPTEAEWEFAARAGGPARLYGDPDDIAWYHDNADRHAHAVAQKRPNAWGLYDMFGNVWEWCFDGYSMEYYQTSRGADPQGETNERYRVVRGGAWFTDRRYLRASYRHAPKAVTFSSIDLGFRCVQSAAAGGGGAP
jgi:formylglycine-generating enzyme required for sulfatase activity